MKRIVLILGAGLVAAFGMQSPNAHAAGAGLTVSPITIEFAADAKAVAVEIANPGDQGSPIQLRLFEWTTDEAGDHYAPSQDIGFSPPIFELPAGGRQTVRMVIAAPLPRDKEKAYRLFVDQIPIAGAVGVQMPVRLILPVFVEPKGQPKPRPNPAASLQWSAERDDNGDVRLVTANPGLKRARLANLARILDGKPEVIREGLAGYALAGESRGWTFPLDPAVSRLEVEVQTDQGPVRAVVPVAAK